MIPLFSITYYKALALALALALIEFKVYRGGKRVRKAKARKFIVESL